MLNAQHLTMFITQQETGDVTGDNRISPLDKGTQHF